MVLHRGSSLVRSSDHPPEFSRRLSRQVLGKSGDVALPRGRPRKPDNSAVRRVLDPKKAETRALFHKICTYCVNHPDMEDWTVTRISVRTRIPEFLVHAALDNNPDFVSFAKRFCKDINVAHIVPALADHAHLAAHSALEALRARISTNSDDIPAKDLLSVVRTALDLEGKLSTGRGTGTQTTIAFNTQNNNALPSPPDHAVSSTVFTAAAKARANLEAPPSPETDKASDTATTITIEPSPSGNPSPSPSSSDAE